MNAGMEQTKARYLESTGVFQMGIRLDQPMEKLSDEQQGYTTEPQMGQMLMTKSVTMLVQW